MHLDRLVALLENAVELAGQTFAGVDDVAAAGDRPGQYRLDLVVDGPLVELLTNAGLGVLSEEAGEVEIGRELVAVLDPIDGSTNASRGLPWFATSISVIDKAGPVASIVINHATGTRFQAERGRGARVDGRTIPHVDRSEVPAAPIIGANSVPVRDPSWAQFRSLGASALDISIVGTGILDGYVDFDDEAHGVWDYLGALHVCQEVGLTVVDAFGRDLVHLDHAERRTPIVARSSLVQEQLLELRQRLDRTRR